LTINRDLDPAALIGGWDIWMCRTGDADLFQHNVGA
jgi:hypothetical protein